MEEKKTEKSKTYINQHTYTTQRIAERSRRCEASVIFSQIHTHPTQLLDAHLFTPIQAREPRFSDVFLATHTQTSYWLHHHKLTFEHTKGSHRKKISQKYDIFISKTSFFPRKKIDPTHANKANIARKVSAQQPITSKHNTHTYKQI